MTVWDSMALNAPHTEREIGSIHETGAGDLPTKLDGFPLLEEAIKEHYGQRCDEYMAGCPCCDTWAELDRLRAIRAAEARELAQDGEPGSTTEPENATCPSAGGFGGRPEHRLIAAAREALEIVKAGNLRDMTLDEAWAQRLSNLKPMATDEAIAHALRNDAGWMAWQEVQRLRAENANLLSMLQEDNAAAFAAVLPAIAAEKATWPHAGVMHAAARAACDNIAERVKQLMGVA